jgi:LysR family cyn operon transcriptional activator
MDVELKYLAAFVAVCEEGGFNKASRKLHLTQPAVSYQVKMLERQLGVRLFERAARGLVITPEGRLLRDYCRRFFSEFAHIRTQFKQELVAAEPLRIASVSGFGRYVLFPLLCRSEPGHLQIDLRFPLETEVLQMVERGDCDLGFVYEIRISSYLQFHPVYEEELVLVASSRLDTAGLNFKLLKTYETLPMITYEEGHYVFGQWFETYFKKQPALTTSAHHFEELEEVIEMVSLNRGLSIVPDHVIASAVASGRLQVIKPARNKSCKNTIFAVTRARAAPRDEVEDLISRVRQVKQRGLVIERLDQTN